MVRWNCRNKNYVTEELRSGVASSEKANTNEITGEMLATKGTEPQEEKERMERSESELFSNLKVVADAEEMKEIRKGVKNNKQEVVGWLSKVDPWVRLRLNEQLT